ncbi:MAG: hypothetical protein ACM3ZQ_05050 [Bacillota bacterium]
MKHIDHDTSYANLAENELAMVQSLEQSLNKYRQPDQRVMLIAYQSPNVKEANGPGRGREQIHTV